MTVMIVLANVVLAEGKQHVHQIGVTANNTNSTSCEMVGLQNVDCLNCTKTVLFPLKNKKRMPVNARLLPEFNVYPSDVTFSYKEKKEEKYFLISSTAELGTLHLLALYAYNTSNLSLKRCIFTLRNDHCNRKCTIKAVSF